MIAQIISRIDGYITGFHNTEFPIRVFIGSLAAIIGAIVGYIFDLVDGSRDAFVVIGFVLALDWVLAVILALTNKRFETRRALKILYSFVFYSTLLAVMLLIERGFDYASWLAEAVMLPLIIFQVVSILKNASLLGLVPQGVFLQILANIDQYKSQTSSNIQDVAELPMVSDSIDPTQDNTPDNGGVDDKFQF